MYKNIFYEKGWKTNEPIKVWIWDDQDQSGLTPEPVLINSFAYAKCVTGEYTSIYGDKLKKIDNYAYDDPYLFESDVPTETFILRELYWEYDDVSTGHHVVVLDIETDSTDGFPNIETANKEITAIGINYDSKYTVFLLDKNNKIKNTTKDDIIIKSFQNEQDLLNSFILEWKRIKPSIVTGWNTDYFDIPYLIRRINKVFGKDAANRLSEINRIKFNSRREIYQIAGISSMDYLLLYKKYSGKIEPNYRLDSIGKKVVGRGKVEFSGSLQNLYETDIEKFIEYNINDVRIVVELEEKLKFIDLARAICHKGHVGYESHHISSKFIEGAMLCYMRRKGLVAPNKPQVDFDSYDFEDDYEEDDDKFEGAYVKEPIPGLYKWVYDLDMTSMYPNTMISLNISPETKMGALVGWDADKYIRGELEQVSFRDDPEKTMTIDNFKKFIEHNNYSVSSNGILYSKNKMGLICEILANWFEERVEYRKLEKKFGKEGNKEKYEFYNRRQIVQKILLNSVYGVLGLKIFRFYDLDNAEAVTLTGQVLIKTACKYVNNHYNKSLGTEGVDYNIYIDTDSLFFPALEYIKKNMPEVNIEDEKQMSSAILKVSAEIQDQVNKMFTILAKRMFNIDNHRFAVKQEVISKSSLWIKKKRYIQHIINKGGIECDEYEVKGLDTVRSSFPEKFKTFMEDMLKNMLNGKDRKFIDGTLADFKRKMKTFTPGQIAKNTTVTFHRKTTGLQYDPKDRKLFHFIKGSPAQVKAALTYNDFLKKEQMDKKIQPILSRSKVKWVYLKKNSYGIDCIAIKDDGTDPKNIVDFVEKYIDRDEIFKAELLSKLESFYAAMKWKMFNENTENVSKFFEFD